MEVASEEVRVNVSHNKLMIGLEPIGRKLNGFVFKGSV